MGGRERDRKREERTSSDMIMKLSGGGGLLDQVTLLEVRGLPRSKEPVVTEMTQERDSSSHPR